MRVPLLLVALILSSAAPLLAQEWIEYSNHGDFFAVNLPAEPKVKDITYTSEFAISLPGHVYTAEDGGSRYVVTVVDYSDAEKKHAEKAKTCKANGGYADLCNDRSVGDLRGAII